MRKSLILISALAIFVGSGILSCKSNPSVNTSDKTNKECPMKTVDKTCAEHEGKPCPAAEGKGPCPICQERQKKVIKEFEELNDQVVEYLQAGDYDKALKAIQGMNNKFPAHPLVLYNMTCIFSLMDKKETAISCLRDAVQCGWKDWKKMEDDSDLDNIRDKSEYKKIRNELKKSSPDDSNEESDENLDEDLGE